MAAHKKKRASGVRPSKAQGAARKKPQGSETRTKTQGSTLAAALSCARGKYGQPWYVFPAPPGEKKSYKAASHSNGAKWGMTNDPEEIQRDFTRWPNAGIGVPAGAINGIIVVDADTLKGHGVDGLGSLKDLQATHGPFPATLESESPSGSVHYFFQHPNDGSRYRSISIAPGVDVKAAGGMVLVPPTRRPDGAYRWRHASPIAAAPAWLLTLLKVEERAPGDDQEAEPDIIAAAMAAIPNDDVPWDEWNRMGMATWRATGGNEEGFAIFDDWSQKSSKYNAATTRKRWEGYSRSPPDSIGAGTIFYLATKADPDWLRRYDNELMAKLRAANLKARKPKPEDEQPKPDDPQPTPEDDEPKPDDPQQEVALIDPWERYLVPPFPVDVFPALLQDYVAAQAEIIGCDPTCIAMSILATFSGALDHRFELKMMRNGNWCATPRLWVLIVGDPGTRKTPGMDAALLPLKHQDYRMRGD